MEVRNCSIMEVKAASKVWRPFCRISTMASKGTVAGPVGAAAGETTAEGASRWIGAAATEAGKGGLTDNAGNGAVAWRAGATSA